MKTHYYDLFTRVLIYREDDRFVAHALDFDLLGYGETEDEARKELQQLVMNQLTFSHQKGKPDMINFPAPDEFFDRWEKARAAQLSGATTSEISDGLSTKATAIAFTVKELKKLLPRGGKRIFSRMDEAALAST